MFLKYAENLSVRDIMMVGGSDGTIMAYDSDFNRIGNAVTVPGGGIYPFQMASDNHVLYLCLRISGSRSDLDAVC